MDWKQWFSGDRPPALSAEAWLPHLRSYDGHEREAAVKALGRLGAHQALPDLIARVNDWVPQVRAAADIAVRRCLVDAALPTWLTVLPALVELLRGRRADHAPLLAAIAGYLVAPSRIDHLNEARASLPRLVQRWLDAQEWQSASEERRASLIAERLTGHDVAAIRWALHRIDDLASPMARPALWLLACDQAHGPVRAQALRRLCDELPEVGSATALRLALDPRAAVRDVAIARLRGTGGLETIRDRALAQLESPASAPHRGVPALLFLATVDPDGMNARCERLLSRSGEARPHGSLRAVALQHLVSASKDEAQQRWMRQALAEPSPRIQRMVVEAIRRGAPPPTPDELWPLVLEHRRADALRRGLTVLRHWGTWTQLRELLTLTRLPLPEGGADVLLEAFDRWCEFTRQGVSAPAEPEAGRLRAQWASCAPALPPDLQRRLSFALIVSRLLESA
ncbi:MAG: hypothetical protein J7598_11225 [Mitsuaria chitosanitabida]|uniref:hypothetical protein n=1 Tax=Roseateles chitosanitabidus TaxID=65048 RepID=UPI001B0D82DF|nr:hypothetical protein [Roseateles chitosanitabidus]MBO9687177.1 hypothetical protein [Roseateles chitosanitabidus]